MELLIQNNASFNAVNKDGWTPLQIAAYAGNLIFIFFSFLYFTICRKKPDQYSFPGHEKVVEILIQNGANMTIVDESDETALHLAAKNGNCLNQSAMQLSKVMFE